MRKLKVFAIIFSVAIIQPFFCNAQSEKGLGISAGYNFQTNSVGLGLRGIIPVTYRIFAIPHIYYSLPFNPVHEIYGGVSVGYNVLYRRKFTGYVFASGQANFWLNSATSGYKKAKPINVLADAGAGIIYGEKCFRPFLEYRYNPIWLEGTLQIGVMCYIGCITNPYKMNRRDYKKHTKCPDFTK